jgi:hypothetical protein
MIQETSNVVFQANVVNVIFKEIEFFGGKMNIEIIEKNIS